MSKGVIIGGIVLLLVVIGVVVYFMTVGKKHTVDYVTGDAVRIERSTGPIMLAEVLVYDNNDKLISHESGVTLNSSPTQPNWGGTARLTDWDFHHPFHSLNSDTNTNAEIKFSSAKNIKRIQLINRSDDRSAEMSQLKIKVLNGSSTVKEKSVTWSEGNSYLVEYDPKNDKFITTNTEGTPIKVTDVVLVNVGSDNLIISEFQILDKTGNNVARTGTATLSSTHHPDWAAANAIDNNLTNTAHSAEGQGSTDTLTINLGGEKEIKSIKIYNRVDDLPTRTQIAKSYVQFKNGPDVVLSTPPIPNGDKATYVYKVGKYINRWEMA